MNKLNIQHTVKNVPVFVPVFLYAVTMLIYQMKWIILSEKWFNYVVTFCFCLGNCQKIGLVGRRLKKKKKKGDGLRI